MSKVKKWVNYLGWRNVVIGLAIYILTLSAGFFGMIKPQFNEYDRIIKEQVFLGDTYFNLTGMNIELAIDSVNTQLGTLQKLRLDYESRIGTEKDLKGLLPFINNLGQKKNVQILSMSVSDKIENQPGKTEKRFVDLTLTAQYFYPLLDFIKELDSYPKWVLLESFSCRPLSKGNELNLQISIIVKKT